MSGIASAFRCALGLQKEDPTQLIVLGLDAAGKTTILYTLKMGTVETTIPTIGFNVETLQFRATRFTSWDVGGRDTIRPLWRHFWQGTHGLIFVVDSNDRDRVEDVREELSKAMGELDLKDAVLLVFANKQDLPNAMPVAEVTEKLGLHNLRNRLWHIQPSCALTGDGLYEGLDWLASTIAAQKRRSRGTDDGQGAQEQKAGAAASAWTSGLAGLKSVGSSSFFSAKFWVSLL